MKSISENKLKAFSIGRMNLTKNALSKKEKEELKKKEEEKKTAEVYNEFIASFNETKGKGQAFVRGDVINPDKKSDLQRGKLYKPTGTSKLQELVKSFSSSPKPEPSPLSTTTPKNKPSFKKKEDKKKSNLELFKEELKIIQAEREQRHALKRERNGDRISRTSTSTPTASDRHRPRPSRFEPVPSPPHDVDRDEAFRLLDEMVPGSHDSGDPMTTNIFLGNVNPKMDEQKLCAEFGKYGPLASVKVPITPRIHSLVMWPRTDEERSRERNCAFVAFMTRKNAEKAMKYIQGKIVMDYEMKLGWGKTVPIPPHPVYVPPVMLERTLPPPPSGLPFNAQPRDPSKTSKEPGVAPQFRDELDFKETLANSVVRVVIPTERNLLVIIHRMIEFVVREGPMFEAMIMNREINNPMFRFLFENQSPAHIYYRWRMYSILQGETHSKWRTNDFPLFKGGSLWRPPPINPFQGGLSDSDSEGEQAKPIVVTPKVPDKIRKELKDEDRDELEEVLRGLLPRQEAVAMAMVFCLDHADAAEEIVECIAESLSILQTPLPKKIARLYLISDILYNCSAKVANSSFFRKYFEVKLETIMSDLHACHANIQGRLRAEQFKQRVINCFRAWEDWAVYPEQHLIHLQNVFLGLQINNFCHQPDRKDSEENDDGVPLEDVDGMPLGSELDNKANADLDGMPIEAAENIDGIPLEEDMQKHNKDIASAPRFVQSKWETVDPQDVEAQAMTTSKWDQLENKDGIPMADSDDNRALKRGETEVDKSRFDPKLEEAKRARLREIEVKVMKFQDDLESGRRERKSDMSLSEQVKQYREKLLDKEREHERKERDYHRELAKRREHRKNSSSSESSNGESSPRKKRKRSNRDAKNTPSRKGSSIVAYGSDDSTDSSQRRSARSSSKKTPRRRSRSRSGSRERQRRGNDLRRRSRSRSQGKSHKRARSKEDKHRRKRKSKH